MLQFHGALAAYGKLLVTRQICGNVNENAHARELGAASLVPANSVVAAAAAAGNAAVAIAAYH